MKAIKVVLNVEGPQKNEGVIELPDDATVEEMRSAAFDAVQEWLFDNITWGYDEMTEEEYKQYNFV